MKTLPTDNGSSVPHVKTRHRRRRFTVIAACICGSTLLLVYAWRQWAMAESLVAAIEAGDYALTKQLLQRGADANGRLHSWVTRVQAVLDVEELRNTGTSDLELNLPTPLLCAIEHRRQ